MSNGLQRVDTGTKCWHLAPNTCSTVVAKSIALASSLSVFRALCAVRASNCRCNIRCDSLVFGSLCAVRALPVVVVDGWPSSVEYESVTSYVTAMQLEYCRRRGLSEADAVRLVVNGYAHDVVRHLPLEASLEVTRLLFSS